MEALSKIGYGLYVITTKDGLKDNGMIANSVTQITNTPNRVAVCINKQNYSNDIIKKTGKLNVNCLSVEAPFSIFENFGYKSGRDTDKFANQQVLRSQNGIIYLSDYINSFFSLEVEQSIDLGSHTLFICSVTESKVISDKETMSYNYYQSNVKPKAQPKKGWVCKICGYVYEGEEMPDDFICPVCKHPKSDFEKIN